MIKTKENTFEPKITSDHNINVKSIKASKEVLVYAKNIASFIILPVSHLFSFPLSESVDKLERS